jgi:hypothetical protein
MRGHRIVSHAGSLGHFTAHVILVPDLEVGVAVLTNASAIVADGHEGQYELSLGLANLLLGGPPQRGEPLPMLSLAAPIAAWGLVAVVVLVAVRSVRVGRPRSRASRASYTPQWRWWLRYVVAPTVAYTVPAGCLLLLAPLGLVRHFYPDVGWGLTAAATLAVTWGIVRVVLVVVAHPHSEETRCAGSDTEPALVGQRPG